MVDVALFHRPHARPTSAHRSQSHRTPTRRTSAQLAALVLFGSMLSAALIMAAPQSASADSTFDRPESPLIEMQVDVDGAEFWEVPITYDSGYIATWERAEGTWPDAQTAMDAVTANATCRNDSRLAYLNLFTTYEEYSTSPTTQITPDADGDGHTWNTTDPTKLAADAACDAVNEWSTEQTTSTETDDPGHWVIRISADQMGPGTHNLFMVNLEYPESRTCSKDWPGGEAWSGYGCVPTFTVEEMTVAVAYPASTATVLAGPDVEKTSAFDNTVFSGLPVMADGGVASTPAGSILPPVGPLLITIALTLVFAILIALPSALLESTLESNESRIGGFLRRLLPRRGAAAPTTSSTTATPGSED
jgi:hypothetical protein